MQAVFSVEEQVWRIEIIVQKDGYGKQQCVEGCCGAEGQAGRTAVTVWEDRQREQR